MSYVPAFALLIAWIAGGVYMSRRRHLPVFVGLLLGPLLVWAWPRDEEESSD